MYIVIVGGGKVGEYLATVLLKSGNEVAMIEEDLETADRLSVLFQGRYMVINGDGCDSKFQEDAGIRKADIFVAVTGQDDANLVSCEIAQRVFRVPRCVARVNSPRNARIFHEVGIECVSATELIASLIEEEALSGSMSVVTSLAQGNISLVELTVPHLKNYSDEQGVLAWDIRLPEGAIISAVSTRDDVFVTTRSTRLFPGDTAIVMADTELVDQVRAIFKAL